MASYFKVMQDGREVEFSFYLNNLVVRVPLKLHKKVKFQKYMNLNFTAHQGKQMLPLMQIHLLVKTPLLVMLNH